MSRFRLLLAAALLCTLVAAGKADARIPIRVGISEQQAAMFDQSAYQRLHIHHVRYFVPWNVMEHRDQRLLARNYVKHARAAGAQVLLHLSTDDYRSKRGHLPSVREYRTQVRRLVPYFRHLRVRDFGVWNEANHASEPTYRSPTRAADFFREMYRAVKGRCRSCGVVALDVLDQRGVEKYMRSFFRHLSPTYRHRATIIGLHNYGDVNRRRTTYTRSMIRQAHHYSPHARIWLTETGGLVKLGTSFPYSPTRAAHRLSTMFSLANRFRRSGIDRLYIYNWTGTGRDARFDAGLTDPDGTPRPGYTYVRRKLAGYLR
ncbi:glycosyl hydrolase [Paraconexibacter antarcticus]|uniref:Glycosyl hydrolase n=1 Tax=Paraconexibacter antarcticus TaxID=2949664 RepID=A0ABY5DM81_9ACTN|nr:glycosyl hydrolase [Paraconexibacter antarcticus]UTI63048.1 glycosyl hydrolase [Paraconexibacter antarcticus]